MRSLKWYLVLPSLSSAILILTLVSSPPYRSFLPFDSHLRYSPQPSLYIVYFVRTPNRQRPRWALATISSRTRLGLPRQLQRQLQSPTKSPPTTRMDTTMITEVHPIPPEWRAHHGPRWHRQPELPQYSLTKSNTKSWSIIYISSNAQVFGSTTIVEKWKGFYFGSQETIIWLARLLWSTHVSPKRFQYSMPR